MEPEPRAVARVGWGFITLYALAYMGTSLVFIAPLLVSLALKVNSLVGIDEAPNSLALVTSVGSLVAMVGNPFFGKMSDRTAMKLGMRRPWMVLGLAGGSLGILVVASAPNVAVVLVGWCIAQLFFNALLAAEVAVLPDQVPAVQRGLVSGVLGVCLPIASVSGTYLVQLFTGNQLTMFLAPLAIGGFLILLFAVRLNDRRLANADRPTWSLREFASAFYVNPKRNPDFAWAFVSRFMFILAYAFVVTYQAYYLLDKIGTAEAEVPHQIFLATLAQSAAVVAASLVGGRLSDRIGRRKIFVVAASTRVRAGHVCGGHRHQLRRFPGRHGDQRTRFRRVRGGRPCPRCRRIAEPRQRQRSWRVQHRCRASVLRRAGDGPGNPRDRRGKLRRPVRGRRRLRRARGRRHPAGETGSLSSYPDGVRRARVRDNRSSSSARRTAARRLFTPSFA